MRWPVDNRGSHTVGFPVGRAVEAEATSSASGRRRNRDDRVGRGRRRQDRYRRGLVGSAGVLEMERRRMARIQSVQEQDMTAPPRAVAPAALQPPTPPSGRGQCQLAGWLTTECARRG